MDFKDIKDEDAVVVCNPTSIENGVPATKQKCDFCGEEVWLADSTKRSIPSDRKLYLSCLSCAMPHIQKEAIQMPSDEQLKEIAGQVGQSFDEVKRIIHGAIKVRNMAAKYESN